MATDALLNLYTNIAEGLVVYPKVIQAHLQRELPFMATENILMDAVKKGGDRQELHEAIRQHSMAAAEQVKIYGKENDLLQRIADDTRFGTNLEQLNAILNPSLFVGRAPQQTREFLQEMVNPLLEKNKNLIVVSDTITV